MIYTDDFMYDILKIEELPRYLYHYTTIETLAMILKNKTIRFNRLDLVNDLLEAYSTDIPRAKECIFVSCWTDQENELIPLWNIYTGNSNGVRIKLPASMFNLQKGLTVYEKGGAMTYTNYPYEVIRKGEGLSETNRAIHGPNKVFYTNTEKYFNVKCLNKYSYNGEKKLKIEPYDLGLIKKKDWEFEQEWRFKISALFSFETNYPDNELINDTLLNFEDYNVLTRYIDIPLDKNAFDDCEIILGPNTNEAHFLIVQALLDKYASKATLDRSKLMIRF